jgi:SAM-dependent methyltransferase
LNKPFSQACENNKEAILAVLREHVDTGYLLEIGSGTGQHAAWLPAFLPGIDWQPSDVAEYLPGVRAWLAEGPANVRAPLELDVRGSWPDASFDYIVSANTFHIMDADSVQLCIRQAAAHLVPGGRFLVYGPFCYAGQCNDSNARFHRVLRQQDPAMGLRDYEWIEACMSAVGLEAVADHAMPANNRTLVFQRT